MFSSQLPKRNSVSIFPASRSTTRTRRACGSVSRRTSRREPVESVASPVAFRGVQRRIVSPSCTGRSSGFPPAVETGSDDFDAAAQAREIGLPYQQGNGRPPIGAFFHLRAAHGAIGGNVKPDIGAINEEELLFRRFVVPAHPTGARKIDGARFGLNSALAIGIALEESSLQCVGVLVARFQSANSGLCVSDGTMRRRPSRQ